MPKVYLNKEDYERDFGRGALSRPTKTTPKGGNVRTQPYTIDRNRTTPANAVTGRVGQQQQQQNRGGNTSTWYKEPPQSTWNKQPQQAQPQGNVRRQQQRQDYYYDEDDEDVRGSSSVVNTTTSSSMRSSGPSGAGQQGMGNQRRGLVGNKTSTALSTAKVLVASGSHPRKEDIRQLLQAYERGWVPEKKFAEELQKLIF